MRLVVGTTSTLLLLNALVPNLIVGERFSALAWFALFGSAVPLFVLFLLIRATRRIVSPGPAV